MGPLTVVANDAGLIQVAFAEPESVLAGFADQPAREDADFAGDMRTQLREYFAGTRREFTVPIDWTIVTGFRGQVLRTLHERIPFGESVSYQGLAKLCGRPTAARTVGGIMGSNPVPIIVPCHRVLASGGGMGGFGPGLEAKRRLLVLEGLREPSLLDDDLAPGTAM